MRKLVYIAGSDCTGETGVAKKIKNEITAFKLNDMDVDLIIVKEKEKWKKAIPFSARYEWDDIECFKTDYLYIRWDPVNFPFIRFLKRIRKYNPQAKIVMEIGMYPYRDELLKVSNRLTVLRDDIYKKELKKYVDCVTLFTEFKEVLGIPAIEMVNCISVEGVSVPNRRQYRDDNIINVIAVASIAYYYGYDRFLRGLAKYYSINQEFEVYLHLVGVGKIVPELKKLCSDLNIENYVKFYGFKFGKELDDIYELADIGIDVLGGHRKGDIWFGSLKSREYMCKGIPFITEYKLPDSIDPIKRYILEEPATEDDINISGVVDFFLNIKRESRDKTIQVMRTFAKSYCDINVAMDPIINFLKGDSSVE